MEIIERNVVVPSNESFLIRELDLKNNRGIIHTHSKYELNLIVNAVGRRFIGGNISRFREGDLIFMAPDIPHCWEIENKEENPKAMTLHFQKEFFENGILTIPEFGLYHDLISKSKCGIFFSNPNIPLVMEYMMLIMRETRFNAVLEILKLFKYLSNQKKIVLLTNNELMWDTSNHKNERIKKIHEYVFFNFRDEIKLKDASDLVGLSEGAFCSFFKRAMKKTFFEFLKEMRVGYACKLLMANKDMRVSDVCFESGYNNFSNFNRQFKEITNLSPREYRNRYE